MIATSWSGGWTKTRLKVGAEDGMAGFDGEVETKPKQGWKLELKMEWLELMLIWICWRRVNWSDEEELKILRRIKRPPSPPCLGSCTFPCKQGEETTAANGDYMATFIETRWLLQEKEMLLQRNKLRQTCVETSKYMVFIRYTPMCNLAYVNKWCWCRT